MSILTAQQLEENEEYEKAYEEYKTVLSQKPENTEVLERLGHLSIILKKENEAIEYYTKLLELNPTNELAFEQLMDLYVNTDKYKYYVSRGNWHILKQEYSHALNDFKKALNKAQTPEENSATRFILATLYEKNGKYNNAIDEYLRILDTKAANETVFLKLANVYLQEDAVTSAIETLERAIEDGFESKEIKETLAKLYLSNNQQEKSRQVTENELLKIKSYLDEGDDEQAWALLEQIKGDYKKDPQYHILTAQYYYNKEDWDKSLECVEEVAKFGKNPAVVCQMKAMIYEGKNMDFEAHRMWAKYNIIRGNKDVALNEYYLALKEKDNDAEMLRELAELLDDMGDKVQAGEFWEAIVKLDAGDKKALERLAEFKESIGAYREQVDILMQLYELNKKNRSVIRKLAEGFEKLRDREKALEYYKKFLENSLMDNEYEKIKQKVKSLEGASSKASAPEEEDEGLIGKIIKLFAKK